VHFLAASPMQVGVSLAAALMPAVAAVAVASVSYTAAVDFDAACSFC